MRGNSAPSRPKASLSCAGLAMESREARQVLVLTDELWLATHNRLPLAILIQ